MARAGRRPRRNRAEIGLAQPPFQRLRNPFRPFEILSADQIEAIHAASLQVLAEIGMNFLLPEARAILAAAGADVEPAAARVRFDPAFVEERIRTAPSAFTLHARNPERTTRIGADWINFAVVGSAPTCRTWTAAHGQLRRLLQPDQAWPQPEHRAPDRRLSGRAGRPAARHPAPGRGRGDGQVR
jgi:trimethylamine:corrinoid methyltransferase-like protein